MSATPSSTWLARTMLNGGLKTGSRRGISFLSALSPRASRSCGARLPLAHAVAQQPRLGVDLVDLDGERQRARLEHRIERLVGLIVDRLHGMLLLLERAALARADVDVDECIVRIAVANTEMLAALEPCAHRDRFGNAARDRSRVNLLDQALRRDLFLNVGRVLDDHMRHGVPPVTLTVRVNSNMFPSRSGASRQGL